jgi:hypothetical protein
MDEVTGTDQKKGDYWDRIHEHYVENLGEKISDMKQKAKKGKRVMDMNKRTPNALKIQWGKIQSRTMKFLKYFQQAENLASGESYDDVVKHYIQLHLLESTNNC